MDFNIKHRRLNVADEVEEKMFKKVAQALKYGDEGLIEAMRNFDKDKKGLIPVGDLSKVFKRLGLISVEEHIPLLLNAGGVNENDTQIKIVTYSKKFIEDLKKRLNNTEMITINAFTKIFSVLMTKKISLFELFVKLDNNLSTKIDKLELQTGLQSLGIIMSQVELNLVWDAMVKSDDKNNFNPNAKLKADDPKKEVKEH